MLILCYALAYLRSGRHHADHIDPDGERAALLQVSCNPLKDLLDELQVRNGPIVAQDVGIESRFLQKWCNHCFAQTVRELTGSQGAIYQMSKSECQCSEDSGVLQKPCW